LAAIGLRKGIHVNNEEDLNNLLDKLPPLAGGEMIQEYVPGGDDHIYEFHAYIDHQGRPVGAVLGQKIRTYPIHFGQSAYAYVVDEPAVTRLCLDTLAKIGYTGAADVDVKRHSETGQDYLLEINPRFSIWTAIATGCGVNLPLMQYREALGEQIESVSQSSRPQRWLWFGSDRKAMFDYWQRGEITPWQWLKSFYTYKGKIEFHVFAWDDPRPLLAYLWYAVRRFMQRGWGYVKRRLHSPRL
jgi:predicted ATP-grasp superfamily ATP-dependent carboligase